MRVRICYTVDVTDDGRRAIRHHYGMDGMATREEVKEWYKLFGYSADDDAMYELQQEERSE